MRLALLALAFLTAGAVHAQFYRQTSLVSDLPGTAAIADPLLVNPWGMSFGPTTPIWVSNAGSNTVTVYVIDPATGAVTKSTLEVSAPGGPSGQVFNGSNDFVITAGGASAPARFIFTTLNGAVLGWNSNVPPPPTSTVATPAATGSPTPVSYTGLAVGVRGVDQFLYAANNAAGRVDVFDKAFVQTAVPGGFVDPNLPAGAKPFNIVNIGGALYVSYSGPEGLIDVFDTDGNLVKRFATGGTLLNPWGMTVAPPEFGEFAGALLVGNFNLGDPAVGPGSISAFDASTGDFLGRLRGVDGAPLAIDGLWALAFGNGGAGGDPDTLYFTAGIEKQQHGLVGSLATCHGPLLDSVSASPDVLWPPNHKLASVAVDYTVADDCGPEPVCTLDVSSNEGPGSWQVVDAHHVNLASERDGNGMGRVYTITVNCSDALPLSSSATVTVTVPHDQGQAPATPRPNPAPHSRGSQPNSRARL